MSFRDTLEAAIGTSGDIHATVRRCFFFDFDGFPIRLWHGQGKLITNDGQEWMGFLNSEGVSVLGIPNLSSVRDGSSPEYRFTLPFITEEHHTALKADQGLIKNRDLKIYRTIIKDKEGLRPSTDLKFVMGLKMKGAEFSETVEINNGSILKIFSASLLCKNSEEGRSKMSNSIYSDQSQRNFAAERGIPSDSGCAFITKNSRRTYTFE